MHSVTKERVQKNLVGLEQRYSIQLVEELLESGRVQEPEQLRHKVAGRSYTAILVF